jgi:hypothetical protein
MFSDSKIPLITESIESRLLRIIIATPFFIIGFFMVVAVWGHLSLPYTSENAGNIVSYTTRNGINPLNDYIRLFLLVVVPSLLFLWGYLSGYKLVVNVISVICYPCAKLISDFLSGNRHFSFIMPVPAIKSLSKWWDRLSVSSARIKYSLLGLTVAVIILNLSWDNMTNILDDGFHDGEMVGYLPVIKAEDGIFNNSFIIHGFGRNILPSIFADEVGCPTNRIYFVRLYNLLTEMVALLFIWLTIVLTLRIRFPEKEDSYRILIISIVIFSVLKTTFFWNIEITGRDAVLFVQVFSLLILLYYKNRVFSKRIFLFAFSAGFLTPLSFLNAYDRAIVGTLLALFVIVMLILILKKNIFPILISIFAGGVFTISIIYLTLGGGEIKSAFEQILYWSKNAGLIWDMEVKDRSLLALSIFGIQNIAIIAISTVVIFISFKHHKKFIEFLGKYGGFLTIFVMSLIFLRMSADRSDTRHLFDSTLPSLLLLNFLISAFFVKFMTRPPSIGLQNGNRSVSLPAAIFPAFLLTAIVINNPFTVTVRMANHINNYGAPDSVIIASRYLKPVKAMTPYLKNEEYFYPLTSEGIWFYMFNLKSPARFHQMLYARTDEFQREVVTELKIKKPGYVIMDTGTFLTAIDSTTIFNSNHLISGYVLSTYKPFMEIENQWFWKYDTTGFVFENTNRGSLLNAELQGTKKRDIRLSGVLNDYSPGEENSVVYLSLDKNNAFIAVKRGIERENGKWVWSIYVPTAILSTGENLLKVWLLSKSGERLYPLGSTVKLTIK